MTKTPLEQVEDKFLVGPGCWVWTGATNGRYGIIGRNRRPHYAHRVLYELVLGSIPSGLTIDHLCRNTLCVRPGHLEPVTHAENCRRAGAAKTHCPQGHEYNQDNTYINKTNGSRMCKACGTQRQKARWQQRKGNK